MSRKIPVLVLISIWFSIVDWLTTDSEMDPYQPYDPNNIITGVYWKVSEAIRD